MLLLASVFSLLAIIEVATRTLAIPASRIESTIDAERALLAATPDPANAVLVVGNSLTQAGVRTQEINRLLRGAPTVYRYAIAQTVYLDWRYGLEGILSDERSPTTVLLLLSPEQFISAGGRGDYSALRLIDLPSLVPYVRALDVHPTDMSRLLFSHFSAYYGFRNELRKNVIGRLLPGVPTFMQALNARANQSAPLDTSVLRDRFLELRELGEKYGKVIVVGSPPLLDKEADISNMCAIARAQALGCLVPANLSDYVPSDFDDGFHLGESGIAKFGADLSVQLKTLRK